MKKYVACVMVAAAAMIIGIPVLSGAQARPDSHVKQGRAGSQAKHTSQATRGKQDFIVIHKHHGREALFVQRSHRRTTAHTAGCQAGNISPNYCTPPQEQNLFGAYAWGTGSATYGSTNSSTCKALGYSAAPCGVYTTQGNTLIVAFVGADGSMTGGQNVTVTCTSTKGGACPVTFKKVNSENAGGGDSEVWYADASGVINQNNPIFVTAKAASATCGSGRSACDVSLQAVTFTNAITAGATGVQATGIGSSSACFSKKGAPSCSLTTTEPDSFVWGALNNPSSATIPTWPSNQFAIGVSDSSSKKTFYSQFLGTCKSNANGSKPCTTMPLPSSGLYKDPYSLAPTAVPAAGTTVTINDTAPTNNPFNEVLVEIL